MTNLLKILVALFLLGITFTLTTQKRSIKVISKEKITVSKKEVIDLLRNFERFPEWSPFVVTDPEQKNHVTGNIGQVGSVFHWEGVAEESKGTQTLVTIDDTGYLKMECDITVPFESKPIFEYQIEETENGAELTQTFVLKCTGFSYFMMKAFGVEKEITKTNILGLSRLKKLLESETTLVSVK